MIKPLQLYLADLHHRLEHGKEHADLTIICQLQTFHVHKAIVCSRSSWFKAACRKGAFREGEESVMVLEATFTDSAADGSDPSTDDSEAVRLTIHYLYHNN